MRQGDFDGDGRVDLMLTTIERRYLIGSLWKRLKGFMGDDIWLGLEFYRGDGGLPTTPSDTYRIQLDGEPSPRELGWVPLDLVLRGGTHAARLTDDRHPRAFNRVLRIGDVTGDGRADLVLGRTPDRMDLFVGAAGAGLFAAEAHAITIAMPADGEHVWLADLNQDGKQDIVLHHPSAPQPDRLAMLLAR